MRDVKVRFVQGMVVCELNEKGLELVADFTGTNYWKDDIARRGTC